MIETILAPIYIYLYAGEEPIGSTYIGGTILIATIVGHSIVAWHDKKRQSIEAKQHVKGRLIKMYTDVMEGPVWGGADGDVVMRRFG